MARASIKTAAEIELMRESCRIVAEVLRMIESYVRPGVTTGELDRLAEEYIRSRAAVPAFKGYGHDKRNLFPASICASVDDEVVHGIPGSRELNDGEIVSVDVGVLKDGFFGDGAWTFPVGEITDAKQKLLDVTRESLHAGVAKAVAGKRVHDISAAVQAHVESQGFSVVRDLVGHGVGRNLHEEPAIPNFGKAGTGLLLEQGMTLAIEPMVNEGSYRVRIDADGWTVRTSDGRPSAHFEHTVLVTGNGPEILTT